MYTLTRINQSEDGTFGILNDKDGNRLAVTVELPWEDNHPLKSCIPIGNYHCIPHNSPLHPDTWEITNVPNRSAILIHSANLPEELKGCVGVGKMIGFLETKMAVLQSKATMDMLRKILPKEFDISIINGECL